MRKLLFIVMARKTVEIVDERFMDCGVDLDQVRAVSFPVRAEDDDGGRFDFVGDFLAEELEARVGGVGGVVDDVGAAVGEEVDGCALWGGGRRG